MDEEDNSNNKTIGCVAMMVKYCCLCSNKTRNKTSLYEEDIYLSYRVQNLQK